MKGTHRFTLLAYIVVCTCFFFTCTEILASPLDQDEDYAKTLISEVRQVRADLQRYAIALYKLQANLARFQIQLSKVTAARDNLEAIQIELENIRSQNEVDKEELRRITEQSSQEIIDKDDINIQITNLKKSISDREKLIADVTAKEVLKEQEYLEEQRKIEEISSEIDQLEAEFKRR